MTIKEFRNKIVARLLIIAGMSLIILSSAVLFNKWTADLFLSIISSWKGTPPAPHWLDKLHLLGADVLLTGAIIIVTGWLVLPCRHQEVSLKQNRFVLLMAPIGEILLIWLLITAKVFSFSCIPNEVDVLPSAKQFVDHDWLPNDWYLNLDIGYRHLFNYTIGTLVSQLGFEYGSYLARLLIYLLLAIALFVFFRTLRLRFYFGLLILLFFLHCQSLIAGEWIVGGVDTKTISYAFAILSFSFFFRKRYLLGFAFAGAAMSFHILIGLYALFCIAVATLLNETWRSEWRRYINHSWPLFITGFFGLQAIIKQLIPQGNVDASKAWEIYVQYRVTSHVLPASWDGNLWIGELVLATVFFLIVYISGKSNATRFVAAYAIGSVLLFLLGLVIYVLGEMNLLRYYWFRFPDVMVPFMSTVLITLFLSDIGDGQLIISALPHRFQRGIQLILRRVAPMIIVYATILIIFHYSLYKLSIFNYSQQRKADPTLSALEWISKNTPNEVIFLVDPTISDFYIHAQRAMFVSWKHSPQSAVDILEWYKRIKLCNGNRSPDESGFKSLKELRTNFYRLDEDQILQIANSYGIRYYLGVPQQQLTFERAYSNSCLTVYRIN